MNFLTQYIIPFLYIIVLAYVLTRIKWLQQAGFGKQFIIIFFIAKCLAGFAYNYVALKYIPNRGDIWPFFEDGFQMYHQFLQSPSAFIYSWQQSIKVNDLDAFNTNSGLIRSAFEIIKSFHFLLSFITFGSLAANTVIFNFLAVLCFFYFWKFLKTHSGRQGTISGLIFFLLPSMFFYSSGILKEGMVISLICLLVPLSHLLISKQFSIKALAKWLLVLSLLFAIKFFVAMLWIFATLVWWPMLVFNRRHWLVLLASIIIVTVSFFYSSYFLPQLNLPNYLLKRQQEFLALPAASALPVKIITNEPVSVIQAIPWAANNVLFKPLPGEGGKAMYLLFSIEIIAFWIGMFYLIWKRKRGSLLPEHTSMITAFLLFAILNLLVIGLIVPNVGAIMRYRSVFLPFLAISVYLLSNLNGDTITLFRKLEKWISR